MQRLDFTFVRKGEKVPAKMLKALDKHIGTYTLDRKPLRSGGKNFAIFQVSANFAEKKGAALANKVKTAVAMVAKDSGLSINTCCLTGGSRYELEAGKDYVAEAAAKRKPVETAPDAEPVDDDDIPW